MLPVQVFEACYKSGLFSVLVGPPGSGKTFAVNSTVSSPIITLTLGESFDPKALIGSYVAIGNGSFAWREGVLVNAMRLGRTLLIEDVDMISADCAAVLPRPGETEYLVHETGERIRISPSFFVCGTLRKSSAKIPSQLNAWVRISFEDVATNVRRLEEKSELGSEFTGKFRTAFERISGHLENYSRRLGFHDYARLLRRVAGLSDGYLSEERRRNVAEEIFACLISFVHDQELREALVSLVLEIFDLHAMDARVHVSLTPSAISCGSFARLNRREISPAMDAFSDFSFNSSVHGRVLGQLCRAVAMEEAVLLVGDTGCGKTTTVQFLAAVVGKHEISVYNFSDQSEASDLLGSVRPVRGEKGKSEASEELSTVFGQWRELLTGSFSASSNAALLSHVEKQLQAGKASEARTAMAKTCEKALSKTSLKNADQWRALLQGLQTEETANVQFEFCEGLLVKACREGHWLILDEINLSPGEVLQALSPLLETLGRGERNCVLIAEGGELVDVEIHPDFRLFACMNPPHLGRGKRALPELIRSRFVELYVDEVADVTDLMAIATESLETSMPQCPAREIVDFYLKTKNVHGLSDAFTGLRPTFSLRTLSRALRFAKRSMASEKYKGDGLKAVLDGLQLFFSTGGKSDDIVFGLIKECFGAKLNQAVNLQSPLALTETSTGKTVQIDMGKADGKFICIEGYWIRRGPLPIDLVKTLSTFVITPSVLKNVRKLACALSASGARTPMLLEGVTGAGKTSLCTFLARITGNEILRINNHEHTDVADYVGQYQHDHRSNGGLRFVEGALVRGVRRGAWVVLDELNLAPTEVLESLNRLLDENRELLISETSELVKAHENFVLFATQNPAGAEYGGRKVLSRAFRNRFLELTIEELPASELAEVIETRCQLPKSMTKSMLQVFEELTKHRRTDAALQGRFSALVTVRDLLRWGARKPGTHEQLVQDGVELLGERLRNEDEKQELRKTLTKFCKGSKVLTETGSASGFADAGTLAEKHKLVLTPTLERMMSLVANAVAHKEAPMLVGSTGLGKTTAVAVVADYCKAPLAIVNCHQHMEIGDLVGGMRPTRERARVVAELRDTVTRMLELSGLLEQPDEGASVAELMRLAKSCPQSSSPSEEGEEPDAKKGRVESEVRALLRTAESLQSRSEQLFEWEDGPLVKAMRTGGWLLLDEVNLADDAVLERLNSVLDADHSALLLTEKPGTGASNESELVEAHENFRLICTMNPGGDFGKKELSPALRNRLTEIWIPSVDFRSAEGRQLVLTLLGEPESSAISECLLAVLSVVLDWSERRAAKDVLSPREVLLLTQFLRRSEFIANPAERLLHAFAMVVLDALEESVAEELLTRVIIPALRIRAASAVQEALPAFGKDGKAWVMAEHEHSSSGRVGPFPLPLVSGEVHEVSWFSFKPPTTRHNYGRMVRAMTMGTSILLEGVPGAGKSAIVAAVAAQCGVELIRVNLSDQTELADLVGQDLPSGETAGGRGFRWMDGPLLTAVKRGCWLLLDELNLAPQPVLEGLNALLDHRRELFVPELNETFKAPREFRIFATQNGLSTAGRKGLPRSFLNRFVKVQVAGLTEEDMRVVFEDVEFGGKLVELLKRLNAVLSPKEQLNLRDALRVADELRDPVEAVYAMEAAYLVVSSRLDAAKRKLALEVFREVMETPVDGKADPGVFLVSLAEKATSAVTTLPTSGGLDILASQPLAAASIALKRGVPLLLSGESGTGKSALVKLLSEMVGQSLVTLHMHSQMDSADLVGQFTTSSQPSGGQFKWQDSALVEGMTQGHWVVLEDAEQCPAAVLDRLNALLERGGVLRVPERGAGDFVQAADQFRIILTSCHPERLSDAIRNRCMEVLVSASSTDEDAARVVAANSSSGIRQSRAVASESVPNFRQLAQVSKLASSLGVSLDEAAYLLKAGIQTRPSEEEQNGHAMWLCPVSGEDFRSTLMRRMHNVGDAGAVWFLASAVDAADLVRRANLLGSPISVDVEIGLSQRWRSLSRAGRGLAARLVAAGLGEWATMADEAEMDVHCALASCEADGGFLSTLLERRSLSLGPRPVRDALSLGGGFKTSTGFELSRVMVERRATLVRTLGSTKTMVDLLATVGFSEDPAILSKVEETVKSVLSRAEETSEVVEKFRSNAKLALQNLADPDATTLLELLEKTTLEPTSLVLEVLATSKENQWKLSASASACDALWLKEALTLGEKTLVQALEEVASERRLRLEDAPEADRITRALIATSEKWLKSSVETSDEETFVALVESCFGCASVADLRQCLLAVESFPVAREELEATVVNPLLGAVAAGDFRVAVKLFAAWRLCSTGGWLAAETDEHADKAQLISVLQRKKERLEADGRDFTAARRKTGVGMSGELFTEASQQVESEIASLKADLLVRKAQYSDLRDRVTAFVNTVVAPVLSGAGNASLLDRAVHGLAFGLERELPDFADLWRPYLFAALLFAGRAKQAEANEGRAKLPLIDSVQEVGVKRRLLEEQVAGRATEELLRDVDAAVEEKAQQRETIKQNDVEFVVEKLIAETADVEAAYKSLESEIFRGGEKSVDELAVTLVWAFDRSGPQMSEGGEARERAEEVLARRANFLFEEEGVASVLLRLLKTTKTRKIPEEELAGDEPPSAEEEEEVSREVLERRSRELKEQIAGILRSGSAGLGFYLVGGWVSVPGTSEVRTTAVFLKKALAALEEEYPDHPTVGNCRGVVERLLELPVEATRASEVLESSEILLDAVEQLTQSLPSEVATRVLRKDATLRDLRSGVAKLRAAELASWRELRSSRESSVATRGAGKWLRILWQATRAAGTSDKELFDLSMQWLQKAPLGEFRFRLSLMRAIGNACGNAVLRQSARLGELWFPAVERKLEAARRELNAQIKDVVKISGWKLHVSHAVFKDLVKKGHRQLVKAVKVFEEKISELASLNFGEGVAAGGAAAVEISEFAEGVKDVEVFVADSAKNGNMKRRMLADLMSGIEELLLEDKELSSKELDLFQEFLCLQPEIYSDEVGGASVVAAFLDVKLLVAGGVGNLPQADVQRWWRLVNAAVRGFLESRKRRDVPEGAIAISVCHFQTLSDRVAHLKYLALQAEILGASEILVGKGSEMGASCDFRVQGDLVLVKASALDGAREFLVAGNSWLSALAKSQPRIFRALGCPQALETTEVPRQELPQQTETETEFPLTKEDVVTLLKFVRRLFAEGIAEKETSDAGAAQEGGEKLEDGTGLGEGQGERDVSDEIEDNRQFDGLKGEEEQKEERSAPEEKNAVEAMDEMDLGEELHKKPSEEPAEQDRKSEEDEENRREDEEDMRMGSVDGDGDVDEDAQAGEDEEEDEAGEGDKEIEANNVQGEREDEQRASDDPRKNRDERSKEDAAEEEAEGEGEGEDQEAEEGEEGEDIYLKNPEGLAEEQEGEGEGEGEPDMEDMQDSDLEEQMSISGDGEAGEEDEAEGEGDAVEEEEVDGGDERVEREEPQEQAGVDEEQLQVDEEKVEGGEAAGGEEDANNGGGMDASEARLQSGENFAAENQQQQNAHDQGERVGASDAPQQGASKAKKAAPAAPRPDDRSAVEEWLKKVEVLGQDGEDEEAPEEETGGRSGMEVDEGGVKGLAETEAEAAAGGLMEDDEFQDERREPEEETTEAEKTQEDVVATAETTERSKAQEQREQEDVEMDGQSEAAASETGETAERKMSVDDAEAVDREFEEISGPKQQLAPVVFASRGKKEWTREEMAEMGQTAESLATSLAEKLRAVLEPTSRSKLQGDYKTGKRIAMRKVLGWIASDYRRDKIWLRRTKPGKRNYRLVVALDNSKSMRTNKAARSSLVATQAIATALTRLEIPELGILSFGAKTRVFKSLEETGKTVTAESLAEHFGFDEEGTASFSHGMAEVLEETSAMLEEAQGGSQLHKELCVVVTDGRFDKEAVRSPVQKLLARGVTVVLVIVEDGSSGSSVYDLRSVVRGPDGKLQMTPFLSKDFPFVSYAVIDQVAKLPDTLADLVKQWFELDI